MQTIDVDVATIMQCYKAVSISGYGFTCNMADLLIEDLRQQVLANISELEFQELAAAMQQAKEQDDAIYEAKCTAGKQQILL